jgi:hypothetical protein
VNPVFIRFVAGRSRVPVWQACSVWLSWRHFPQRRCGGRSCGEDGAREIDMVIAIGSPGEGRCRRNDDIVAVKRACAGVEGDRRDLHLTDDEKVAAVARHRRRGTS